LVREKSWADYLYLAPFIDYGKAWNDRGLDPDPDHITSAGLGLKWAVTLPPPVPLRSEIEIYWGIPFRDIDSPEYDLQDDGIHFQIAISTP
jgi:hemolysin activation/secretion protein